VVARSSDDLLTRDTKKSAHRTVDFDVDALLVDQRESVPRTLERTPEEPLSTNRPFI
jgi:hypothetical protein